MSFFIFFWCFQSKIVRVLNLWQKNAVFKSDIIQPLLDMAAGIPPPSVTPVMPSSAAPVNNTTPGESAYTHTHTDIVFLLLLHGSYYNTSVSVCPGTPATPATPANIVQGLPDWASQITNTDTVAAVAQILQSPQGQQVSVHPTSQIINYQTENVAISMTLQSSKSILAVCVAGGVKLLYCHLL